MAKSMTRATVIAHLAEKASQPKKTIQLVLDELASLACREAKKAPFTVPGIGKLVLRNRKARMGRNPQTGESIKIPAKQVVKFRVMKAARIPFLEQSKSIHAGLASLPGHERGSLRMRRLRTIIHTTIHTTPRLFARRIRLVPGESVQMIITAATDPDPACRVRLLAFAHLEVAIDREKCLKLLLRAAETLLGVLGYDHGRLKEHITGSTLI